MADHDTGQPLSPRTLDVGLFLKIIRIVYSSNSTTFQKINLFGVELPKFQDVIQNLEPLSLGAVWEISEEWK